MNIKQYTDTELQQELERRAAAREAAAKKAVAQARAFEQSDAIATALRACAVAVETGIEHGGLFEPMNQSILDRAGELACKLAYNTLSGGGHDPQSGMNAGWESEGFGGDPGLNATKTERDNYREPIDAVLTLCFPQHAENIRRYTHY